MVQTHQVKLSDYYVKKNSNTITENNNTVTAANKNVATDSNGNIIFEDKPVIDSTITSSSNNAVKSSAIYSALSAKQTKLSNMSTEVDEFGNIIFSNDGGRFCGINDMIYHDYTTTNQLYFINSDGTDISFDDLATLSDIATKQNINNISQSITTDYNSTSKYPSVQAVATYVNSMVDTSFQISIIQDYTVQDLEDDYDSVSGEAFGQYMQDNDISYNGSTIYLLEDSEDDSSYYNEYILVDDNTGSAPLFELLGTTKVDLSGYATITALNNKITSSITNGNTTQAPSSDAVYDALALKLNTADFATQLESVIDSLINEANQS